MTLTEDQLILVGRIAHSVAYKWPDCSAGDLRNQLIVHWLELAQRKAANPSLVSFDDYWEMEDQQQGMNKLNSALVRFSHKWCRLETAAVRGHDDYHQYTRYQLKMLLPSLHDVEAWGSLAVVGRGGRSGKLACEGGDSLAVHADLTRAFDMLSVEDRWLLNVRFVFECVDWLAQTVDAFDCTVQSARNRCSRALDRLERALAGRPLASGPVYDRRMVMSNARALSELRNQYDG